MPRKTSSSPAPKPSRDLYAEVTAKLIAAIRTDPGDPRMPWRRATGPLWRPVNAVTNQPYRGINVVMLWGAAETATTADGRAFTSNQWATYRQWGEIGAQVRKGERAATIVKYGEYQISEDKRRQAGEEETDDDGKRLYLKAYHVFNAAQVDGAPIPDTPPPAPAFERIAAAEAFIANTGARIVEGGDRAFYRPSTDTIHMPDPALFTGTATMSAAESWAAVKAHETLHWTSAPTRLDRRLGQRFGDDQYAAEELIAEIGSALICADLAITQDVRPDHAQYLASWLRIMRADAKAIFTAAAAAERAVRYLHDLQPKSPSPDAEAQVDEAKKTPSLTTSAGGAAARADGAAPERDRAPRADAVRPFARGRRRPRTRDPG